MSRSIINNKQNYERYIFLQIVLFDFAGIVIMGILEEELGPSWLIGPVVHQQCVLPNMLEVSEVLTVPDHKWFQFVA